MANTTVIMDPNDGGLLQTRLLLWILTTVIMANKTVIVDPVNCLGVSKHASHTVYAPFMRYKCNYLFQPSDRQQYTSTLSTKYGVCVLSATPLLTLTATIQHRSIYFLSIYEACR